MKNKIILVLLGFVFFQNVLVAADAAAHPSILHNWPQWRGPLGTGEAPLADPPAEWSEDKNIKWKAAVPGAGFSTPIVWGDKVFLLTAIATGQKVEVAAAGGGEGEGGRRRFGGGGQPDELHQFVVLCLDRKTGKEIWRKTAREEVPHEGHHRDHTFASASPVTDGEHLIAYFGSRGLYCYDMDGNLQWEKDFGNMRTRNSFGEGASPALSGNTVVVNWDHEGDDDFIVALDKRTGEQLWRKERDEATSWSTPLIVYHDGKMNVIVNASGRVRSYDLSTGEVLWSIGGQTANAIPSPVAANGVVYVMSGFRGNMLQAIRLGHTGELEGTEALLWTHNKSTPYVPSPLLTDDLLYFFDNNRPSLTCFDVKSGKPYFEGERIEGMFGVYASPVSAKDRVYLLGRDGSCVVIKKGPKLEVLAVNKLNDKSDASLALADNEIFLRSHQHLYCIAAE